MDHLRRMVVVLHDLSELFVKPTNLYILAPSDRLHSYCFDSFSRHCNPLDLACYYIDHFLFWPLICSRFCSFILTFCWNQYLFWCLLLNFSRCNFLWNSFFELHFLVQYFYSLSFSSYTLHKLSTFSTEPFQHTFEKMTTTEMSTSSIGNKSVFFQRCIISCLWFTTTSLFHLEWTKREDSFL